MEAKTLLREGCKDSDPATERRGPNCDLYLEDARAAFLDSATDDWLQPVKSVGTFVGMPVFHTAVTD
jgi:hypothetical protein